VKVTTLDERQFVVKDISHVLLCNQLFTVGILFSPNHPPDNSVGMQNRQG